MVTLGDFRATWKRFGVTRGSLWSILVALGGHLGVNLEHFGLTLGSLWFYFWVYEGCLGATLVYFQTILIFRMNFHDFIYLLAQLDATWGTFWG